MTQRVAIVGTAPSWQMVPWTDTTLQVWSLNDAYQLKGFQRADRWYDIHPLHKFYHPTPGTALYAHQIPAGHYVRPEKHLAWLASQQIPVFLNPDYLTQHPAAATWPNAHAFPKAAVEAHFGRYFTSTPALLVAHAVIEGCRDISVYGIHLATQQEYMDQRPGFEYLLGKVLGVGKQTMTVKDGLRHYTTADGHVALPEASPVLQAGYQYGFEPRPSAQTDPIAWELHKIGVKRTRYQTALLTRPSFQPFVTVEEPTDDGKAVRRRLLCSTVHAELAQLAAEETDWKHALARIQVQVGALTCR